MAVTLRAEGYSVVTAADGKSAIEALRRDRPALVLQDMQLPDMDGADLIQRLHAFERGGAAERGPNGTMHASSHAGFQE